MESYKVSLKRSVEKDLRKIDKRYVSKIVQSIEELAGDPFPVGSRKLVGSNRSYRVRVGDYRVIYLVDTEAREIEIQRVRHRKEVYE